MQGAFVCKRLFKGVTLARRHAMVSPYAVPTAEAVRPHCRRRCFHTESPEQVAQIRIGIDVIGFAGLDERVQTCAGVGTADRIGK